MKAAKLLSVFLVTLGMTSQAMAIEEKFEENYKVEGAVKTERQIASEKEKPTDREPSSVTPPPEAQTEQVSPQPWLHKVDKAVH
jgi:hypothetical protein